MNDKLKNGNSLETQFWSDEVDIDPNSPLTKLVDKLWNAKDDYELTKEETAELMYWENLIKTWATVPDSQTSLSGNINDVSEAIDHLTTLAAEFIGMGDHLGSIESGKLADMAVFDENLRELSPEAFSREHACMTIVGGEIVYDAEAENDMEMYTLMSMQHL